MENAPMGSTDFGRAVLDERAAAEIEHDTGERLVHRQISPAVAADAALVTQRLGQGLAERDAGILDGVVQVDLEVPLRPHGEIDQRVPSREQDEHVIEERDAGGDLPLAGSVDQFSDTEISAASRPSCDRCWRCAALMI